MLPLLLMLSAAAGAQTPSSPGNLVERGDVKAAFASIDNDKQSILALWRKLTLASAPSGHEDARAALVMEELRRMGYEKAYRDKAGNLVSAPIAAGEQAIVFVAHLDTVVQPGVKVEIKEGKNDKGVTTWIGPGVGDDTSGVTALLAVAKVLPQLKIEWKRPVVYVFSVNEEGGGSSGGIKQFLDDNPKGIAAFISTDGSPIDELGAIADSGVGYYGLRPVFKGPGVHTIESYGVPSTTHAVALAIDRIYRVKIPRIPLNKMSWLNVGTINAGTVGNAMARESKFSIDLRSNDAATGRALQKKVVAILEESAKKAGVTVETNARGRDPIFLNTPEQKALVETLRESYRALGITPTQGKIGSSDFVIALAQGVPSVGIGLTNIRRMHSPEEEAEVEPLFVGIKEVVLAAAALASK